MSAVVYAKYDMTVVWSQGISVIALGDVWDSEAELAVERPDLFSTTPTLVRGRRLYLVDKDTIAAEVAEVVEVVDKPGKRGR
jgi:hypothetical protein